MNHLVKLLIFGLFVCRLCPPVSGADWPAFRGPTGNGIAPVDANPPLEWDNEKNIAWKLRLPAPGNGSPIVIQDTVYVTVANKEGSTLDLLAIDREAGTIKWKQSVNDDTPEPTHGTNPYASSTPVADEACVVVWYGDAGLHAYSHAGEKLWSVETPGLKHIWGYGSSPVMRDGRVFLSTGIGPNAYVAAYSSTTGETLWNTPEPGVTTGEDRGDGWIGAWGTPVFAHIDGELQMIVAQPTRVVAYAPETGEILWFCEGLANLPRGNLVYSSLMLGSDVGVALGGFNGPGMGFRLGGRGNVTETHRLWRDASSNPQRIGSGVVIGPHLFMANAGPGVLQCLEIETGKELWRARPSAGGNFWGSILLAGERLYVTNQEGTTLVFAPNSEKFEQLAENRLNEHCNSTPAIVGTDLFLRTYQHLYRIRSTDR